MVIPFFCFCVCVCVAVGRVLRYRDVERGPSKLEARIRKYSVRRNLRFEALRGGKASQTRAKCTEYYCCIFKARLHRKRRRGCGIYSDGSTHTSATGIRNMSATLYFVFV